jgi:NADPH-dependent 2,4-dienoyl-CoA reductase/sulfur reductase-like enzyme
VDETLQAAPGIYAAGDIATFPDWRTGGQIRVEHWRLACQHGRLAGTNLARHAAGAEAESAAGTTSDTATSDTAAESGTGAAAKPYRSIPYFWTVHFGTSIRYVGHIESWDEIIYHGSPEERKFIAFYVKGDDVLAASGTNCDTEMSAIEELMRRERMPTVIDLKRGEVDYVARLND